MVTYLYLSESRGRPIYNAHCPLHKRDIGFGQLEPMTKLAEAHDRCFHAG